MTETAPSQGDDQWAAFRVPEAQPPQPAQAPGGDDPWASFRVPADQAPAPIKTPPQSGPAPLNISLDPSAPGNNGQMSGLKRAAAIPATGFAEGFVQGALPFGASVVSPMGDVLPYYQSHPEAAAQAPGAIMQAGKDLGLYQRPDLKPEGALEQGAQSLARGAGRALANPLTYLTGGAGAATTAATGAVGGLTGDVAEQVFPDHPVAAQIIGNIVGSTGASLIGATVSKLAAPVTQAAARSLSSGAEDTQAMQRIADAMQKDVEADPTLASKFREGIDRGMMPWEIEGAENTQALAGDILRSGGTARTTMRSYGRSEDIQAAPRVQGALAKALGSGDINAEAQALDATRKTEATPIYESAYQAPPLNPDEMAQGGRLAMLMQRPSMQQAMSRAVGIAKEEGRDPNVLGFDIAPDGSVAFKGVPSWQTLDYVKRGLDDTLESTRNPVTGRLTLDEAGRAMQGTRVVFRNFLRSENPAMGQAWDAWGGPSQSLNAINEGKDVFNKTAQEIRTQLSTMSPGDQRLYRLSAMQQAIGPKVSGGSLGSNEAARVLGNTPEGFKPQIEALFPNRASRNAALQIVGDVNSKFQSFRKISGGSQTAERLADSSGHGAVTGPVGHAIGTVGAAMAHEPFVAMSFGQRLLNDIIGNRLSVSPSLNANIAKFLTAQGNAPYQGVFGRMGHANVTPYSYINMSRAPQSLAAPTPGAAIPPRQ